MAETVSAICAAAESALLRGDVASALGQLDEALRLADDPHARTTVQCARVQAAMAAPERAAILDSVLAEADALADEHPDLASRLLCEAALLMLWERRADAMEVTHEARRLAESGDGELRARADVLIGMAHLLEGNLAEGTRYLSRVDQLIRVGGSPQQAIHLVQHIVISLSAMERYAESMALCRQYVGAIRRVGADGMLPFVLCLLSNTAYFTSEFDVMEMSASEALALATATGQRPLAGYAHACLAMALAVKGESEAGERHAQSALADIEQTALEAMRGIVLVSRAMRAMGQGDWQAAIGYYRDVREFLRGQFVSGIIHFRADEIEAMWRAGDRRSAADNCDAFLASVDGEGPWERAVAERVAALVGPAEHSEARFSAAMRWHEQSPSGFERARTELCWGEWLAARGRVAEARGRLESARAEFRRLATEDWARRADELLGALADVDVVSGRNGGVPTQPAADAVQLHAFGPLRLRAAGSPEIRIGTDIAGELLRYLVVVGGAASAEQVADVLWPEAQPEHAMARLRTVLSRARSRYGPLVVRDGSVIRLAADVEVDSHRFDQLARSALAASGAEAERLAAEAVELYSADLLPLARYTDWTASARERARQRYIALLNLLADSAQTNGDLSVAIVYAQRRIDVDPLDDDAYVRLGRLLMAAERYRQAREVIDRGRAVAAELDLPIPQALVDIARQLGGR